MGLLALQRKVLGSSPKRRRNTPVLHPKRYDQCRGQGEANEQPDERTPLRSSFRSAIYADGEGVQEEDVFDDDSDDERLSQEIDEVFGKFPGRLLNHHVSFILLSSTIADGIM